MKIEFAKLSDAEEILKMLNGSSEVQTTSDSLDYDLEFVKTVISDKKLHICLVARENDQVAGVLVALLWPKIKECFTVDLIVKLEFRKKGIGTSLNKFYENILKKRNVKGITSFVLVDNKKMQKLKDKLHYKKGKKFYFYGKKIK